MESRIIRSGEPLSTIITPDVKKCAHCEKEKSLDSFHRNNRTRDGRQSWCKLCVADRQRERMADPEDPLRERIRDASTKFAKSEKGKKWYREYKAERRKSGAEPAEKRNADQRERYRTDPEYRAHKLAKNRESYHRNKTKKVSE